MTSKFERNMNMGFSILYVDAGYASIHLRVIVRG